MVLSTPSGSLRGVMASMMECDLVVSEFEL